MKVILLERVEGLGNLGEEVTVKDGFARNYLLPQSKALRATADNVAYFEKERKAIEANNAKQRDAAAAEAKKVDGVTIDLIRQASEGGQLYGSVAARDIAEAATEAAGTTIGRSQVVLNTNIKMLGLFPVKVSLHPEVQVEITVNIARSAAEAEIQRKTGKALIAADEEAEREEKRQEAEKAFEDSNSEEVSEESKDDTEAA